ncbi:hypothetical protein HPG69_004866 [Diceros bicornis minor]|uniref:Uncharacterized protein n=1 Tax=Diceros bicornis minor TaxID=77932 RepID=A0A7J7E4W8_DICBM|nr:hypothetical protein HPG69_004866 [Diceros bicornis minor]
MEVFAMGVSKDLYSGDIPCALRGERTVVLIFQIEVKPSGKKFEEPETTRQTQSNRDGLMLFSFLAKSIILVEYSKGYYNIMYLVLYQPQYSDDVSTFFDYLTTAVIIFKDAWKCRQVLKDLDKSFNTITEFIEFLYVNFDFDVARKNAQCSNDYFLRILSQIVKTSCHIHQCISINMLTVKLKMISREAEG